VHHHARKNFNKSNVPKTIQTYEGMLCEICTENTEYIARKIRSLETIDIEAVTMIKKAIENFNSALAEVSERTNIPLARKLPKLVGNKGVMDEA
jgi:hypothetical protein